MAPPETAPGSGGSMAADNKRPLYFQVYKLMSTYYVPLSTRDAFYWDTL